MSYIQTESKRLAVLTGQPLHSVSLAAIEADIKSTNTVSLTQLSENTDVEIYKLCINTLRAIGDIPEYTDRANSILASIENKFEILNKRIRTSLYEKIKSAKLLNDYTISKVLDAFDIELVKQSFTSDATAEIVSGKILGISAKGNGNISLIDVSAVKSIKVEANNGSESIAGTILKKVGNGWAIASIVDVLNTGGTYNIKCEVLEDGPNELTVNIDLGIPTYVESICPIFTSPEIIKVYTSLDGSNYNLVSGKCATKNKTFLLEDKNIRYIKLIIFKPTSSHKNGSKYIYESALEQIKISAEYEKEEVSFETKTIGINKNLSKISITTNDNYDKDGVSIEYQIKINDKDYQVIRPSNKSKNKKIGSILETQLNVENQIIEIKDSNKTSTGFEYDLEIPQAFMISNNVVVMGGRDEWDYLEDRYRSFIFNYKDIEINVGTKTILVDGEPQTGVVQIKKGIRQIDVYAEDFIKMFNKKLIQSYVIDGATIRITLRDGTIETITDTSYPYNLKLLIEENSDFVFRQILKEGTDYKLNRINANLKIECVKKEEGIYCIFNNLYTLVSSIRIKGILKSLDNKTIPEINKITVRAE